MLTLKPKMQTQVSHPAPRSRPTTLRLLRRVGFGVSWVLASLGVHGALLWVPLGERSHPEGEIMTIAPEASTPEPLTVVSLPTLVPAPAAVPAGPLPAPPPPAIAPEPPLPEAGAGIPQAAAAAPTESPTESPAAKDSADPAPAAPPQDIPTPPPPEPPPYADFPHPEGAAAGCQGVANCWRSPAGNWSQEAQGLRSQLEAQGYDLDNITDQVLADETGVRIYAVRKNGAPEYYLNFISVAGALVYAMTEHPMTQAEVDAIAQR